MHVSPLRVLNFSERVPTEAVKGARRLARLILGETPELRARAYGRAEVMGKFPSAHFVRSGQLRA